MNKKIKHYPLFYQKGSVFIKKILIILAVVISILVYNKKEQTETIPIESIRIRIIANSNSIEDQNTKLKVKEQVEKELYVLTEKSKSIEETRNIIENNITNLEGIVANTLEQINIKEDFVIKYGINYFPEKIYKGQTYKENNYESLVITLGKGEGDNWWCVLFPPLCLMDVETNEEEIEYEFILKKIIKHFM